MTRAPARGRHRAPAADPSGVGTVAIAVAGLVLVAVAVTFLVLRPTAAPAGTSVADLGVATTTAVTTIAVTTTAVTTTAVTTTAGTLPSTLESAGPVPSPPAAQFAAPGSPAVGTASPVAVGAPGSVSFPGFGVSAPVLPVGVDDTGLMAVPADVSTVGWYRFGPAPGDDTGSAVLTGHVDTADQGPGVFADLARLVPGDPVEVTDVAGTVRRFQVVSRESWPKDQVPLDRLFDRSGPGRLVLITCGGAFDPQALSYEENLAITAVPVQG